MLSVAQSKSTQRGCLSKVVLNLAFYYGPTVWLGCLFTDLKPPQMSYSFDCEDVFGQSGPHCVWLVHLRWPTRTVGKPTPFPPRAKALVAKPTL